MSLDICAGILAIAIILVLLYITWLYVSACRDSNELMDENRQLRDTIATAESRESMSKMRTVSRGGRVPK